MPGESPSLYKPITRRAGVALSPPMHSISSNQIVVSFFSLLPSPCPVLSASASTCTPIPNSLPYIACMLLRRWSKTEHAGERAWGAASGWESALTRRPYVARRYTAPTVRGARSPQSRLGTGRHIAKGAHKHPLLLIHVRRSGSFQAVVFAALTASFSSPYRTRESCVLTPTQPLSRVLDRAPSTRVYPAYLTPANCTPGTAASYPFSHLLQHACHLPRVDTVYPRLRSVS